jgi:hypothetical protein
MVTHEIHVRYVTEDVEERRGRRLGAYYKEDSRNKDFEHPARMMARAQAPLPLQSVRWPRHIHVMDQNRDVTVDGKVYHGLGSCCPNSGIGVVSTGPFTPPFANPTEQRTIVPIYEAITRAGLDQSYWFPPHDNGSNILDFQNYALQKGWISEFNWVYTFEDFLQALMHGPCHIAIAYFNSYDRHANNPRFPVDLSTKVSGWHALCADEVRLEEKQIWYTNSWGIREHDRPKWNQTAWDGRNYQTFGDVKKLFQTSNIQVAVPIP